MTVVPKSNLEDDCVLCGKEIDFSKKYVVEEITHWNNDVGKSVEKNYHELCFARSRR